MRWRGPLANSYAAAAALVIFALVPYLAVSSALTPLLPVLSKSLGLSSQALQLTNGIANAAYAIGTVIAVQFAVHLRGRRMLILYATLFVIASAMTALAFTPGFFIAGHVLQGLCTSLMLIAAVPPLVIGWPTSKMPITGAIMNMCVFGAVAVGPVIGGVQAAAHEWQPLFWLVTGSGGLALLLVLLTFEDQEPQDRSAPWDLLAMVFAAGGAGAAFFGASELETHRLLDVLVFVPLVVGVCFIVALVVHQYTVRRPLMPVRQLATTKPVAGIIAAMCAGAASVAAIDLAEQMLKTSFSPLHAAMLFWPEFGAAVASAVIFASLFRTRLIAMLAFAGLIMLSGGIVLFVAYVGSHSQALVVIGSGLVGLGVGSSVAPALFVAGFSVPSAQIQRVFALVELLRAVAAFLVAPIVLHLAMTVDGGVKGSGVQTALWVCFALAAGGALVSMYVFVLGRARLQRPDLERWEQGDEPAWVSPPFAAGIRRPAESRAPARPPVSATPAS